MLNLVCGSIFLLRGLCGALCFVCYDWPNRLRFGQCSFVVAFVDGLFIYGCSFLRFDTLRMSTRRLSVMHFVFSFRVTVISCYLLRGVPVVAEEFFVYFRPTACTLYDFP